MAKVSLPAAWEIVQGVGFSGTGRWFCSKSGPLWGPVLKGSLYKFLGFILLVKQSVPGRVRYRPRLSLREKEAKIGWLCVLS